MATQSTTGKGAGNPPAKTCDVQGLLNETQGSCVTSHVAGLIPVVYKIDFDTAFKSMPYAIKWREFKQPDARVAIMSGKVGTIRVMARTGQTVGIYLGSDASPKFRNELLYAVTVGHNDIEVAIKTKTGLRDEVAEVKLVKSGVDTGHGDKKDFYEGVLTGDIWMRFSHRYDAAEAATYATDAGEKDSGILEALKTIYGGSVERDKGLKVTFADKHECKIAFQHGSDSNCVANIKKGYTFSREGLPRVHPNCWIALLQALHNQKAASVTLTSGWRPMIGSSGHRIGLGLDIKDVKRSDGKTIVFDTSDANLYGDDKEKAARQDWLKSEKDLKLAQKSLASAQLAQKAAKTPADVANAGQRLTAATAAENDASEARKEALEKFATKHAGTPADHFEQELLHNLLVKQLLDPIIIDTNTTDKVEPHFNAERPGDETNHKSHLHITSRDEYLMP